MVTPEQRNDGHDHVSRVRAIVAEILEMDGDNIPLDADLNDDLGTSSLETTEIIVRLEREFGVAIPDSPSTTVRSLADALVEAVHSGGGSG